MNKTAIDNFLNARDVPGVVALVTSADEVLYHGAVGVRPDATFAIMSMTKPITSVAIMMLQEQGKLSIDEPACKYLEKFREQTVVSNVNNVAQTFDEIPQDHDFTIRELLAHTAGFGYKFCNDTLFAFNPKSELAFPLLHQPGSQWTYGVSTLLLGNIIETVTDLPLGDALEQLVLGPLEMTETSFKVRDNQTPPYRWAEDSWQPQSLFPEMPYGDGGLISTAEDYAKFLRCLLNNGAPLLGEASFAEMKQNQIGELFVETQPAANPGFTFPFPRGGGVDKWGLGFQIHMDPAPGMRSPGSFSWCGLLNTYFWVDPTRNIAGIIMMQLLPLYEPRCLETLDGFERLVYQD